MSGEARTIGGTAVYVLAPDGPLLDGERAATDLIGEALGARAELLVVPVGRLAPGFLALRTRIAGEAIQKFVNYGLKVAFVGDVSEAVGASDALRDFVRESNRGRHVWFVADEAELAEKLARLG
ncbi:MAG: DUF4180 domain-containing protein [Phenylobacterium sp.]|uniref:DUF4180 domain-containing protein n=1 Tax=Phenylobacterium sp. TaxID=1871053 RepID=UPI0025F6DC18|nr:DUF4180 domain-containing protein [Phenylobacterium sp.]MBI1199032.1 DUF4180 domain-containing protein [Phenylobacterium sp.]